MHERETTGARRKNSPLAIFAGAAFALSLLLIGYLVFFASEDSGRAGNVEAPPAISEPVITGQ